ncbi:hypothetical protein PIB30_064757 [Stylosanthes scabra]|uniref:Uncharacterized protein n=1 Tax=Stylosanthes scabra TaxID=79078 RepID=A0ABU6VK94_9FABA|nr:hypothetical protein [Stylosanthes scabra]
MLEHHRCLAMEQNTILLVRFDKPVPQPQLGGCYSNSVISSGHVTIPHQYRQHCLRHHLLMPVSHACVTDTTYLVQCRDLGWLDWISWVPRPLVATLDNPSYKWKHGIKIDTQGL